MSNHPVEKEVNPEEAQAPFSERNEDAAPQEAASENPESPAKENAEENPGKADEASDQAAEELSAEEARKHHQSLLARRRAVRQKIRKRIIAAFCILAFLALLGAGAMYYIKKESGTLEVSFYHLQSEVVGAPFRIVQLSDLHLHEFGEKNAELVDWVRRLNPDIIAITGDMNNHFNDDTHVVTDLCSKLAEITDVYYVMGNHEWVDYIHRNTSIRRDIVATGVTLLENNCVEKEVNGNKIIIGGLVNEVSNYEKFSAPQFMKRFMQADGFKLLLVHYPEYFLGTLNHYSIDLALCGHVHGGIIRLPRFGGVYSSDQGFFPKLYEGMQTVSGGSVVVVSRGLGGEGAIPRINNNPELVVIDVSWY